MIREDVVKKRVEEAGVLYKTIMLKAYAGTAAPRSAIKAFCLHCTGEDREAIRNCSGFSCPLWAYRPYSKGGTE